MLAEICAPTGPCAPTWAPWNGWRGLAPVGLKDAMHWRRPTGRPGGHRLKGTPAAERAGRGKYLYSMDGASAGRGRYN